MTRGPVALGNPTIKTNAAMHLFYVHEGVLRWSSAFETAAAVEVGTAVRAEVQKLNQARQ